MVFDFVRSGVPNAEGKWTKQLGRETVHFRGGLISLVEVEVLDTLVIQDDGAV